MTEKTLEEIIEQEVAEALDRWMEGSNQKSIMCNYCGEEGHSITQCRKNCMCEVYPGQHAGSCY